jgi:hypothetical protein
MDSMGTPDAPDGGHPTGVEPQSSADLARSVDVLRKWLIALSVLSVLTFMAAAVAIVIASVGLVSAGILSAGILPGGIEADADPVAVKKGPPLGSVASLPVDASGEGTIQGAPTGEATSNKTRATFVLVLDPAPAGLPPRTTLNVAFDRTTKVYRDGQALGDPLAALDGEDGPSEADPTAASTVKVRFHIKDGRVFADRLDLSNEWHGDES